VHDRIVHGGAQRVRKYVVPHLITFKCRFSVVCSDELFSNSVELVEGHAHVNVPGHLGQGPADEVCTLAQALNLTLTFQMHHE
jgi:hypothetical protein